MFLGQFYHNIDNKGRLMVPSRYRAQLEDEGAYVMRGFDENLMVMPASIFLSISQRINQLSLTDPEARRLRRYIFSTADRVQLDRVGRILIPAFLRELGGIDTQVVVVGNGSFFELWSPEKWDAQAEQLQDAESNASRFTAFVLTSD